MNELTKSQKKKLLEEAAAEFPNDVMMQDIHYIRLVQYHQTKDLPTRERVLFYQKAKKRVGTAAQRVIIKAGIKE